MTHLPVAIRLLVFGLIFASPISNAYVQIRIVDVGAGLCILSSDKDTNQHFLYDAGRWDNSLCADYVNSTIGNEELSLVVVSHPDADHLSGLEEILRHNTPNTIVHTGYIRKRVKNWRIADQAIANAELHGSKVINLTSTEIESLAPIKIGKMKVEFVYGLGQWDVTDPDRRLRENERRNAISISVKLSAYNNSVFLPGDIVGRHDHDSNDVCKYSEKDIVESSKSINSDILIAPHHGANNASSACFLKKVSPSFIVFSAGHKYEHPRSKTVSRILDVLGINERKQLFRTDRGDDEGDKEWDYLRLEGCKDRAGDDDIEIIFKPNTPLFIHYLNHTNTCQSSS